VKANRGTTMAIRLEGICGEDYSAAGIADALEREGGPAEIIVNSPGGSATEGAAIFAEIRAHPSPVTVRVRGIAASAASLLVMAGDDITIAPAASMMLHDPMAITMGNADQHRASLAMLEELSAIYAQTYAAASGQPVELVREWMRSESWLSPEDAIALTPRYLTTPAAKAPRTLHSEPPFDCIACGKPFGSRGVVERIAEKLVGKHWMFADDSRARLIQMCDDCRVRAQHHGTDNPFRMGERPRPRTTDDDLAERAANKERPQ